MSKLVIIAKANSEGEITEVSPFRVSDDAEAQALAHEAEREAIGRATFVGGYRPAILVLDESVVGTAGDLRDWIREEAGEDAVT